jgi:hypothetical protein
MDVKDVKIGDRVECAHDADWQLAHQRSDELKARKRGVRFHMGNAAAYMHLYEGYVVVAISPNGGVQLRGFCPKVSAKDIQPSTKPNFR